MYSWEMTQKWYSINRIYSLIKSVPGYKGDQIAMNTKRIIAGVALCAFLCVLLLVFTQPCSAQGSSNDMMQKEGIEGVMQKSLDKDRLPNKFKITVGIVMFPIMFAVVKWL